MARKDPPRFNNPFVAARADLARVVQSPPPAPAKPGRPGPISVEKPARAPREADDASLFLDEMAGVAPLVPDARGRVGAPEPSGRPAPSRHAADEAEAYASLADLIEGTGPFDIADTDEFVEGIAPGLDRRLLKRLRKGDFALQGHLDLHGMTQEEARAAVETFVARSRASGKRCVLIIHGRGLNSKDQIPVLKERVKAWLERGRISRSVLAFSTARPCDGGAGAVYVLLRR